MVGNLAPTGKQEVEGFKVDLWSLDEGCGRNVLSPNSKRRCTIELRSTDFDPYLIVAGWSLVEDDDSGGGRNARVTIEFFLPFPTTIVVTSARKGESGSYTLRVRCEL